MMDFHPAVSSWFERRFGDPTEPQKQGWPAIRAGGNVLIGAPTGSGKTLAAFLCAIDHLVKEGASGALPDQTLILYISPLKALANDIQKNLLDPLSEIQQEGRDLDFDLPDIHPLVRTGDTLPRERRRMSQRPPHILVTTPESVFILLTSEGGRQILKDVRTVIVDEIHALARDKRGAHLSLSLERLEELTEKPFQRIGLSATQKPIESIANFLAGPSRPITIIDIGHRREMQLAVEVPRDELGAVASNEMWEDIYERLSAVIEENRTTLVFVNTRRLAERVAHHLAERLGESAVAAHHGSLSREIRLGVEQRLKQGELRAVVATASLELGIDIGSVDLVCQIGSTRSIAVALQRVGRSGHWTGAVSKGLLFPSTRDELLECAALVRAIRAGSLDRILIPEAPLDILAQQIVAASASCEWSEEGLLKAFQRAAPYAGLTHEAFDSILGLLSEGISTRHGRRGAYLHRDRVNRRIRARRNARLAAITSGGAIPELANYLVKLDPEETVIGTLDEDFAIESMRGDIFLLGSNSWRIRRVESGSVRVEDAHGAPPTIPFWRGEAPARTSELSETLSQVREEVARLEAPDAIRWLQAECGLDQAGAEQATAYVHAAQTALGALPTQDCIVAERFFDEAGGMQLVIHAPLGGRINKAWGLALRKRFCRSFNFELQAAATENGILISLSDQHSFPLDAIFSFLSPKTVREVLLQAMLATPLFGTRWRWNVTRALAILRFANGRKVPPSLQRIRADDLLAAVFPEQAACQENIQGEITVPEHPLVDETVRDCLTEAMDVDGLSQILEQIESGQIRCVAVDTPEPSPLSHEILNSNPYTFLDDAPLEERRARAVQTPRRLLPAHARELGALNPEAIREVADEAWPTIRDADELHDALLTLGILCESDAFPHLSLLQQLVKERRAYQVALPGSPESTPQPTEPGVEAEKTAFWVAAERVQLVQRSYPEVQFLPSLAGPEEMDRYLWDRDRGLSSEDALREIVRCRMENTGPTTVTELASLFFLPQAELEVVLHALEAEGQVLRGSFRRRATEVEWCDRRILARIHSRTLGRLRREIEPVTPVDLIRFLLRWQHLSEGTRLHGEAGLRVVLEQLQGFEAPASAWEASLLPARVDDYEPEVLDRLCLSGEFVWARLTAPSPADLEIENLTTRKGARPSRITPVAFFRREEMPYYLELSQSSTRRDRVSPTDQPLEAKAMNLSHPAREVLEALRRWGASFLNDLVKSTGRLPIEVEEGLWELVATGTVTADGFDNLRALMDPRRRRGDRRPSRLRQRRLRPQAVAGRWSLLSATSIPGASSDSEADVPDLETVALQLLERWGVVFRDLLAREPLAPPWRELLHLYRSWEARGRIRGGRFVSGFVGEQFALPQALEALRTVRRNQPKAEERVRVSPADPLNLIGIILPGTRLRPASTSVLDFRDGLLLEGSQTKPDDYLERVSPESETKPVRLTNS